MPKRKQAATTDEDNNAETAPASSSSTKRKKKDAHKKQRTQSPRFSKKRLSQWYQSYREADEDCVGPNGIERFCNDLGVEPEDVVLLVIAWHLGAARMGYFSEEEWMRFADMQVDNIEKLQNKLPSLRAEVKNPAVIREIYHWSFSFAKDAPEQKTLDVETASGLISLLLQGKPHADAFAQFITEQKSYKVINKDQWTTFLDFSESIRSDMSDYDENAAWPVLFDDFVNWSKKREE